jgi:lantibiotic modifying enzyme
MRTSFRSIAPPAADPVATAAAIGARLAREAIWHRGACNWVGAERSAPAHRALGPGLGSGTAGIALFLAELHAATGDGAARATALGAIGQALARAGELAPAGLYDGRPGIAYAAARCGLLLGEERLTARALRIARARPPAAGGARELAGGTAGTIAALLAIGGDDLALRAARLGDELAAAPRRGPRWHPLCGLPDGASGIAWALLELFALTGEPRHRAAAERELGYERAWHDASAGDWPDLRGVRRSEPRGSFRSPYPATWAHGAPGIALARLRAWELLGDGRCRDEAATALATTAARLEQGLLDRGADFTLAHGLGGRADVLLRGAEQLPAGAELARRSAATAAGRYGASVDGWPCGVAGGAAPALLDGHAGIGLLYLRLHDPAVPSALLVGS